MSQDLAEKTSVEFKPIILILTLGGKKFDYKFK